MSNPKRGRPIGSGIDDREVLGEIAEMIAANPGMKPTTAIKKLGIRIESTIRRLRGKWKTQERNLMAQVNAVRERARQKVVSSGNSGASSFGPYDVFASRRALGLAFPRTNSLEKAALAVLGKSIDREFSSALGLQRSHIEVYEKAKRIADDMSHSTMSKLIAVGVSSTDELVRLGDVNRTFGRDVSKAMYGTDQFLGVALDMYGLARKYA